MTINLKLDLNEDQLRRVRAAHGRGGKATRNECRVWLNRLIAAGIIALPEPKVRGRKPGEEPQAVTRARAKAAERRERAEAAPEEALCHHCRKPKADHGRMGFSCPAPFRGTAFEAALKAVVAEEYEPIDWNALAQINADSQDADDEEVWTEFVLAERNRAVEGGLR